MLTAYFAHHALYGRHGVESNRAHLARALTLAAEVARLEAERRDLVRDVDLLRDDPHPDIVAEAARRILGYTDPDAIILSRKR